MEIVVQKFGGTSLSDQEAVEKAALCVQEKQRRRLSPCVVVSAMGRSGDPYATDSLLELAVTSKGSFTQRNLDLLLSCGEVIAATVFVGALRRQGVEAQALTGAQAGIITNDEFASARIQRIETRKLRQLMSKGIVPVIAGFQGVTLAGEITTLGRGGSDTTAAAVGAVLGAHCVEIYTDVNGVKTADPRLVPDAPTIAELSYQELMELAHLGTRVIHPRAVEIAMESQLALRILSLNKPGHGTLITGSKKLTVDGCELVGDKVVAGIAHIGGRAQVKLSTGKDFNRSGLGLQVFDLLARAQISVDLIYVSPKNVSFIVDEANYQPCRDVLTDLELSVQVETGYAKVSVVGAGMHGVPGVMARVMACLDAAEVDVYQTSDSHANISCLIREEYLTTAVTALYREFKLDNQEVIEQ